MKPEIQACILTLIKKIKKKVLNLKLKVMLEYKNRKKFLYKAMLQIFLKKLLLLQSD